MKLNNLLSEKELKSLLENELRPSIDFTLF